MQLDTSTGLVTNAAYHPSPNCDARSTTSDPETVIIHCISLPPGEYGGNQVVDFFTNQLDEKAHPYFADICHLKVSAHFYIRRSGELFQFVPTNKRAWHAGESVCLGRANVNDFSVGIELEGLDTDQNGFTDAQYTQLRLLLLELRNRYSSIEKNNVFAHSDIAPGRKPDPGPYFDWERCF